MKNMTPTPWKLTLRIQKDRNMCPVDYMEIGSDDLPWWIAHVKANDTTGEPDAAAIVSAVNNTYGNGINPYAVEEMLETLKATLILADKDLATKYFKRSPECQAMYDRVVAAIKKAQL